MGNKKQRQKAVQEEAKMQSEKEAKKNLTRQKLKGFVKDINQKIFKNRHIAKMLNTANSYGLLAGLSEHRTKGSHLHVRLANSVGTATLVRAHGRLDATTKKFVVQRQ